MKDEIKKETTVNSHQDDTKSNLSRREFVSRSTGTLAAASALAAAPAIAADATPTNSAYEPGNVLRYGIVPNDTTARTANTTALVTLLDPANAGPVGRIVFPNTTGRDTYYFNGMVEVRPGCQLDLQDCTIDFNKTYESADDLNGFFTFIRNVSIENGTINVDYDGSSGTNAGMVLRIGSRPYYTYGNFTSGVEEEDLTDTTRQGQIILRNLVITTNNGGPHFAVLMLGGLEGVLVENVVVDGGGSFGVEYAFYYEFGFQHYEATVANRTTSHAFNMHFKNIQAKNLKSDGSSGAAVALIGAYNCVCENISVDTGYGVFEFRPGEALFYNVGSLYGTADMDRVCILRNLTGQGLTGIAVNMTGAESACCGYLSGEGLTESQQVDLMRFSLDGFSFRDGITALVCAAPVNVRNGSIKNQTAEGIRLVDECVDFHFDRVEILDGSTCGIRGDYGANIFSTERKKVGSITNCFIAGNANNGIDIDHTESVFIGYNRIGYNTDHDAAGESTQNIGINVQSDGDGVVCEGNKISTSGGSNAYTVASGPINCEIRNPRGNVTTSGAWMVEGIMSATATDLQQGTNVANTGNKYEGKLACDPTTGIMYRAAGAGATDVWKAVDGGSDLTPT